MPEPAPEGAAPPEKPEAAAPRMDPWLRNAARRAIGFMPDEEGMALYEAGLVGGEVGPLLEIGSYCGRSAIYLGAAARDKDRLLYSIDHHRGSEEHQAGEGYHDPRLVDPESGLIDTLPTFRRTIEQAGLEEVVVGIVARSEVVARDWRTPLGLLFIDGSHSSEAAERDYEAWTPHVEPDGILAIHDVFESPEEGGRPPFEIYQRALDTKMFVEVARAGSLRVLKRRRPR
jgi:MMP 1-O-methyltransferase